MKRLLNLMVVVVAVFMVGFTTVFAKEAESINVVKDDKYPNWYEGTYDGIPWAAYNKHALDAEGNQRYAFCLDSGKNVDFSSLSIDRNWSNSKVDAIITKAMQPGFKNQYGLTDTQFYGVVQSAIWKAVHGEGDDGYYGRYQEWIAGTNEKDNNYGRSFQKAFDALWAADNTSYSVNLVGDTNLIKDGDYLVTELIVKTINVPEGTNFTVTISDIVGKSAGVAGADKKWNHTITVKNGDTIYVRMPIDSATKDYSVKVKVTSAEFETGYKAYYYKANSSDGQNIAVAIPTTSTVTTDITLSGKYTKTGSVTVSKNSSTGEKEIEGASMKVYGCEEGNKTCEWTSKEGVNHQIENLIVGNVYRLQEVSYPDGYDDSLEVNIYFKLLDGGKTQLCNVKNNDIENAVCGGEPITNGDKTIAKIDGEVLTIINYPLPKESSVLISKKDFTNGEEIAGAKLKICTLEAYEKDGNSCTPSEDDWTWTSEKDKSHKIALQPGEYVLFETLPVEGYEDYMLINDGNESKKTTAYRFKVVEGEQTKIAVYNELKKEKVKIPDVPSTGVTTSAYLIGGLVMLAGAGTIVVAKKKENI